MLLNRLENHLDTYSAKQRKIALYLLSSYDKAAFMTAEELAEACDISQPTVIRFARYLGYSGYKEFQNALRMTMRDRMTQAERLGRSEKLVKSKSPYRTFVNSMLFDIQCIQKTIANLKEEDVTRTAEKILNARRVYVVASHAEYGVVSYLATTLGWVKEDVLVVNEDYSPSFDKIADADSRDIAIAYSFPPYPERTVRLFRALKNRHVYCIAVTDSELSPLSGIADIFYAVHDEKLFFSDNIAAAISLLSAFLAVISSFNAAKVEERMALHQEYWNSIGFYYKEPEIREDAEKHEEE